ncbi:MAG: hypothetical protein ABJH07_10705 [Sedimentitalea sp.]|uniref:hypothetical protein n=1 Tax=Sedimentitalea sp. TaxID=2048915 RepID=UPI0032647859
MKLLPRFAEFPKNVVSVVFRNADRNNNTGDRQRTIRMRCAQLCSIRKHLQRRTTDQIGTGAILRASQSDGRKMAAMTSLPIPDGGEAAPAASIAATGTVLRSGRNHIMNKLEADTRSGKTPMTNRRETWLTLP